MSDNLEILVSSSRSPADGGEPVPGQDEPAAPAGARRRPSALVAALGAWAVLATVAAVVLATWWAPLHNEARDRRTVQALASEFAVHLTTFEGEEIDDWVDETQEWATGSYAEQLDRLFDLELRDALREAEVTSEGTLLNLFVQDADGEQATVFAVVRQTVDNQFTDQPFEDELRMEITMESAAGSWRVSDVAVLGPGGLAPGTPLEDGP